MRPGSEREIATEARYWLGETYYRLGRIEQADWLFRQVAQDLRQEFGPWALYSSGWTALRMGDATRARDAFTTLLARPVPVPLDVWGQFGLGLASYALGRHEDALAAFGRMQQRTVSAALARDVIFWQAEALGRTGDASRAADELKRFVDGGAHPLLSTAQLRLAWWTMVAGRNADAVTAFRSYLAGAPAGGEREWGEAGLTLALLGTGDWAAARDAAAPVVARRSPLAMPLRLRLVQGAVDSSTPVDIGPIVQELLGGDLTPAMRSWVLLVKGEVRSGPGQPRRGAHAVRAGPQRVGAGTPMAAQAGFRLARINFELREYPQALSDLAPLASAPLPADLRIAVLILQGEAAYQAGDHATAGGAFRRVLLEFPDAPQAPMVRLAVAWTSLRQGRRRDRPPGVPRVRAGRARQPLRRRRARARRRAGDGGGRSRGRRPAARAGRADVSDAPAHRLRAAQSRHPAGAHRRPGGARRPRCATGSAARRSRRCSVAPTPRSAPRCSAAAIRSAPSGVHAGAARRHGSVREPRPGRHRDEPRAAGTRPSKSFTEARDTGTPDVDRRPPSTVSPRSPTPRAAGATSRSPRWPR